jgi:hypothetical protein
MPICCRCASVSSAASAAEAMPSCAHIAGA